jgi:putative NADH-flavin reductase
MQIGIFGATGVIGQRVLSEAVDRGHHITAFSRERARFAPVRPNVTWAVADPLDADSVSTGIAGLDVVVNAINTGSTIQETIDNAHVLPAAAVALLAALDRDHPRTRLIVIGGAGSLEVAPGLQLVDVDGFADRLPTSLGVPAEYAKVVQAHREALNIYRLSNRNWTYLSPSSGRVDPGPRTTRYRIGTDQLLTAADGSAAISAEDLAVALLDEIELPRHVQRRFTVGY